MLNALHFFLSHRTVFVGWIALVGVVSFPRSLSAQAPVYETPEAAAEDPDFPVQGEYEGDRRAMQVIAMGAGEFEIVVYEGGLPGKGWDRAEPRRLDGDADVVTDLADSMMLTRVDRTSPTLNALAPPGATILFDGSKESVEKHWKGGRLSPDGFLMQGTTSHDEFQDYRLHLEFRTPFMPQAKGQARGNSGIYHQGRYETQILDSFGLKGRNNEAGGIYEVSDPSLNACLPPLAWQTYDVDFTAAKFNDQGEAVSPARITARLNGIIVQNDVAVPNPTRAAPVKAGPLPGPIYLQDHGNPIRFRNIWVLPRDPEREAQRPIIPGFERFFADARDSNAGDNELGGELLLSSLACNACHSDGGKSALPVQRGPDLSDVAERVRPDALVEMIANPRLCKTGTTMPDPWPGLASPERLRRAESIASFLILDATNQLEDRTVPPSVAKEGDELYHSIGCVACHAPQKGDATPQSTTVPLGNLSQKYTISSLAGFLREPHRVRPGVRMPKLVNDPGEAIRIAAYLLRETVVREPSGKFTRKIYRGQWDRLPDFSKLTPVSVDEVVGLKIDDIQPVYNYAVVFEAKLHAPKERAYQFRLTSDDGSAIRIGEQAFDNDGIHPATTKTGKLKLEEGVQPIVISYFQGGGEAVLRVEMEDPKLGWLDIASLIHDPDSASESLLPQKFLPQASLLVEGQNYFQQAGCKSCHVYNRGTDPNNRGTDPNNRGTDQRAQDASRNSALPLAELNVTRGCLADSIRAPAVDYGLTITQRDAIRIAIARRAAGKYQDANHAERIHITMAGLNCYACHARDNIGGTEAVRDAWFKTTTPEMGNEGRLPPPLDGVGDKLNDEYFKKLLAEGANERPYMKTRMPGFDFNELRPFHAAIVESDRRDEMPTTTIDDSLPNIVGAGRTCVGNAGLACIKCHRFRGEPGGGIGAIDMLKMTERLRKEWFVRYLLDPQAYRPGTRMPSSFVDGKSSLTTLYNGQPLPQIEAMWVYLSQGDEARVPEGLIPGAIVLAPEGTPRIYRNFITGASPRAIAVGYPGGVNLVWDAEHMTMPQIWKNSFIDAAKHWNNRGVGNQAPLGDAVINLGTTRTIGYLSSLDESWPSESSRELGCKFRGYTLDDLGQPIFQYTLGDAVIHDQPVPIIEEGRTSIRRKITVSSGEPQNEKRLVWSAARGRIQRINDSVYRVNDAYNVQVQGTDVRIVRVGDQEELRGEIPVTGNIEILQEYTW